MSDARAAGKAMEWALELEGIGFRRQGREILSGVTWRVPVGGCCAVLGPNGAGKSTLMALITGYLWTNEGQVTVFGQRFGEANIPELRRRIGVVSHSRMPRAHGDMTVLETVFAGSRGGFIVPPQIEPTEEDLAAARAELAITGMAERGEAEYGLLSSGEQMRVLLARAMVARPELLILDEPTASLDMAGRAAFIDALDQLKATRPELTILLVTHYVEDLPAAIQDVVLLREGRVMAAGGVREVLTSENLSAAFGCAVELFEAEGRHWTRVRPRVSWKF